MHQADGENKKYELIDLMKFALAYLIVCSHFISENAVGRINTIVDYASSLYVVAVPFFFACSGFFVYRKLDGGSDDWSKVKSYCRKIIIMYIGWSAVFFLFTMLTWIRFGTTYDKVLHYFINAFFYSTYRTIWFLPATVIGVLIAYLFTQKIGIKGTVIIAIAFYIISCLGASYSFLFPNMRVLDIYNYVFVSTRNGVFNGFPFVMVGFYLADKEKNENIISRNTIIFILTMLFGVAFVVEALLIKKIGAANVNTLVLLLPFTYYFLKLSLNIKLKTIRNTLWFRKMSTSVFLCQRLFLSALPDLFPESIFGKIIKGNPYIGLLIIILLTTGLAAVLIELSKKNKWLAKFC